jgi:hypothetical protein
VSNGNGGADTGDRIAKFHFDKISTTCGSEWVDDSLQCCQRWLTHPLSQVVLTLSKMDQVQEKNKVSKDRTNQEEGLAPAGF